MDFVKQKELNKNKRLSILSVNKESIKVENVEKNYLNFCCSNPKNMLQNYDNMSLSLTDQ